MQPVNANGIQVVWMTPDSQLPYANMRNDLAKQLILFGSLQIALGSLSAILQIASVILCTTFRNLSLEPVGYGIWTGAMFIVTGSFGIFGGRRKSRCHVITFNVLSILSSVFAAVLLSLAVLSAVYIRYDDYYYYGYQRISDAKNAAITMDSLMAVVAMVEGIAAIWSSVICCKIGACCCDCDGDCCCPPSQYQHQSVMPGQFVGQSAATHQQPIVMYSGSDQQQLAMMANQQTMYYAMPSAQLMVDQNFQQQMGQGSFDRDKLVE